MSLRLTFVPEEALEPARERGIAEIHWRYGVPTIW